MACTGYWHVRIQYRDGKMNCEASGPDEPQKERKWICFTTLERQGSQYVWRALFEVNCANSYQPAPTQIPEMEINYRTNVLVTDVPTGILESFTEIWTRPSWAYKKPMTLYNTLLPFTNSTVNILRRCGWQPTGKGREKINHTKSRNLFVRKL